MTQQEARDLFEQEVAPLVRQKYGWDDTIALAEEWNNWTDALCTDGEITSDQYNDWDNPY